MHVQKLCVIVFFSVLSLQEKTTPLPCWVCVAPWRLYPAPSLWPASSPASVWSTSVPSPALRSPPARTNNEWDISPWWCCVNHTETLFPTSTQLCEQQRPASGFLNTRAWRHQPRFHPLNSSLTLSRLHLILSLTPPPAESHAILMLDFFCRSIGLEKFLSVFLRIWMSVFFPYVTKTACAVCSRSVTADPCKSRGWMFHEC